MKDSNIKWAVGLSDGTNAYEGKKEYRHIEGELSPWQRLLKYTEREGLEITSLSLYFEGKRWNLPSKGSNPKFREFTTSDKPIGYKCFRKLGADILQGGGMENEELYTVAEAEYEDYKLQVWVLDKEPYPSWTVVV